MNYVLLFLKISGTKFVQKMLFKIPSIRENVASFLSNIGKFNFKKFKKLYSSLLINSVAERRRVLGCDAVQAI